MRFLCPRCTEPIQVADDLAGKVTLCPLCGGEISVPPLFAASQLGVSASEALASPMSATQVPPMPSSPTIADPNAPAQSAGGTKTGACSWGVTLCPDVLQWVAPVCFGLIVILTLFFDWNGAFPGGHAVYTQGAFKALAGGLNIDPDGENVLRANPINPPEGVTPLRDQIRSNWLLLLVIPVIFLAFVVSIIPCVLPYVKLRLPPQVQKILPWQWLIIAAMSVFILLLLGFQAYRGFGLENAIRASARQDVEKTQKLPDYPTVSDLKRREIHEGVLVGRFQLRQTTALRLVFLLLIVAVVASGTMHWLTQKPGRAAPRIECRC